MRKYSIQFKLKNKSIQNCQRNQDRCIIHDILSMSFSITMLKQLNACMLLFQVTFLSDLVNNTGTRLPPSVFRENNRYRKRSTFHWSKQNNPGIHTWSLWKEMITTLYCRTDNSLYLKQAMQLGQWKCNHFHHTQIHPYIYSPLTKEMYQQKSDITSQWYATLKDQKELHIMLDSATICSKIPSHIYPIKMKDWERISV